MCRSIFASLLTVTVGLGASIGPARPARAAGDSPPAPAAAGDASEVAPPPRPAPPRRVDSTTPDGGLPFRLGVFYAHAFGQSGDLTHFIGFNGGVGPQLPSPAA